jgi:predicted AlkP superfamily pyrophosphatase or phosphodiesterase
MTAPLAALSLALASSASAASAERPAPKLVVTIVIDQFGADLFNEYRSRFTGGLKTLADQGVVYANGYQSHAATETCPGHSTVMTGVRPNRSGIPSNIWLDRATGKDVYCLAAPANSLADGGPGENGRVGPDALRAQTLGDWLKASSPGSRVFAVSGKDRGAITLAGHRGDGVFWFHEGFGFTTYVEPGQDAAARLDAVAPLNARLKARFAKRPQGWTYQHPACRALESDWTIGGEPFHSALPPKAFELDYSPILDEVTLEAATTLLDDQKLGRGAATDVLTVSLSGTDRIGHRYGTQGPEMCEQLLRVDAALAGFLSKLKALPGGAVVVLTADHGGSDFPERLQARGFSEAQRGDPEMLVRVNRALRGYFGLDFDPVVQRGFGLGANGGLYLMGKDRMSLAEPQRGAIGRVATILLNLEPTIENAELSEDAAAAPPPARGSNPQEYTLAQRQTLSAVPGRSADILLAWKPGITPGLGKPGVVIAGHGSPWDYDRKVPVLFWWPGSTAQERTLAIETVDIAPTLAHVIGLQPPADLDGRCLDLGGFAVAACPQ